MDEFIKPVKNQKKKNRRLYRQIFLIILLILCLSLGFIGGYFVSKSNIVTTESTSSTVLEEIYEILNNNWVNTSDEDVDVLQSGLVGFVDGLGDSHSSLFTSDEATDYNDTVGGDYYGIGVGFAMVSKGIVITKVYENTPAYKAGILAGDIITDVDGTSLVDKTTDDVQDLVKGSANSTVSLSVIRDNEKSIIEVTRGEVDTSTYYEIRESNSGKKFGYIQLTTFGTKTADEVGDALQLFKDSNVTSLVIDLRNNGGGYLNAAVGILDYFFDTNDIIYQMKTKDSELMPFYASSDDKFNFNEGYVLVNENSASASELTSGALQEGLNYKLVGVQTYGKGSAQTQTTLSNGDVLKYTYALWYTPDGENINGEGITPDIEIEQSYSIDDIPMDALEESISVDTVSDQVRAMQQILNLLGYDCGRDDGYFSDQTQSALESFEEDNNLTVNGDYDEDDHLTLISQILIYINSGEDDTQYEYILDAISVGGKYV